MCRCPREELRDGRGQCMQWLGQRLSTSLGKSAKAEHCRGQGSTGKSHGTINSTIKREKLSGCTFAWPTEGVPYNQSGSPINSAELPSSLSRHGQFSWAVALPTLTAALKWHRNRWQQWSQRLCYPLLLQYKFSPFQSQEPPSDCSFHRFKMNCWHANPLQPPSAGSVPVCSGKLSSAAQPCPCVPMEAAGLTKGLFLLGSAKGFAMTVKNLSPVPWSTLVLSISFLTSGTHLWLKYFSYEVFWVFFLPLCLQLANGPLEYNSYNNIKNSGFRLEGCY